MGDDKTDHDLLTELGVDMGYIKRKLDDICLRLEKGDARSESLEGRLSRLELITKWAAAPVAALAAFVGAWIKEKIG